MGTMKTKVDESTLISYLEELNNIDQDEKTLKIKVFIL